MVNVLILAGAAPPRPAVLLEALEEFRERGAIVHLGCYFPLNRLPALDGLAEAYALPTSAPRGGLRRPVLRAEPTRRMWLNVRSDPWLRRRAQEADILVALDWQAVYLVWRLAQRHPEPDAVYGLAPSLTAVEKRLGDSRPVSAPTRGRTVSPLGLLVADARRNTQDLARTVVEGATGRKVMRVRAARQVWTAALGMPGIPDSPRARLAQRVQESMKKAGHGASAAGVATAATRHLQNPGVRAKLLTPLVDAELAAGRRPEHLETVVAGELATADALYRAKDLTNAIAATGRVLDRIFNRALHIDTLSSPIAEDPAGYLGPYHNSAVGRALAAPRGRSGTAGPPPTDRPLRLLVATGLNDHFVDPIRRHYETVPEVEVRRLDLTEEPLRTFLTNARARLVADGLAGGSRYTAQANEIFGPHLAWADTILVDWCAAPAAMLTLADPGNTRVIVRLHRFEAFSVWPHLIDFSRVDDLVFVSEHMRELTMAAVPRLSGPDAPRTHVLANAMSLRNYVAPKDAGARFTVGVLGIGAVAKDPRWAIEVLRLLRAHDPRYRLLLIGSDIKPEVSPAARRYREAYERDLVELESTGAVRRLGQTRDVAGALTQVGVILSSSVSEGAPYAVVEGTASAAVPVVRNWPFYSGGRHGADTLYPADWVVDTPEQAAARILAVTETERIWQDAGREAAAYVFAHWDWSVVQRDFDRLLLGGPSGARPAAAPRWGGQ
ncbi:glycosyltransferase family 1 protein [Plantactinospora sp. B5E13]|uniref:glycosyltransferase family 1 protein n=1 Tax=Plantactinospora sp. B5E13 TaxID=3153758 RepID=UPI00325CDF24